MLPAVPQPHHNAPDCEQDSRVARRALDQSSRYADLSLDEATLIKLLGLDQVRTDEHTQHTCNPKV